MHLAIACDHAAFDAKQTLRDWLREQGHEVSDCGPDSADRVDYPDYARRACELVQQGKAQRAILLCGSGIGMSMAANKMKGIRAAMVTDLLSAQLCRQHNDANVLCMGARISGPEVIKACAAAFLTTEFEARHQGRIDKISALEGC